MKSNKLNITSDCHNKYFAPEVMMPKDIEEKYRIIDILKTKIKLCIFDKFFPKIFKSLYIVKFNNNNEANCVVRKIPDILLKIKSL